MCGCGDPALVGASVLASWPVGCLLSGRLWSAGLKDVESANET